MTMFLRHPYSPLITVNELVKGSSGAKPDFKGLLLQGRPCQSLGIDFRNTHGNIPFAVVRQLISRYVYFGSTGFLVFYSQQCGDDKQAYPLLCDFRLSPWLSNKEDGAGEPLPPMVFFKWKTQHGGNETQFSKFFSLCRELGLKESEI
jgi:hypothetical protein